MSATMELGAKSSGTLLHPGATRTPVADVGEMLWTAAAFGLGRGVGSKDHMSQEDELATDGASPASQPMLDELKDEDMDYEELAEVIGLVLCPW